MDKYDADEKEEGGADGPGSERLAFHATEKERHNGSMSRMQRANLCEGPIGRLLYSVPKVRNQDVYRPVAGPAAMLPAHTGSRHIRGQALNINFAGTHGTAAERASEVRGESSEETEQGVFNS